MKWLCLEIHHKSHIFWNNNFYRCFHKVFFFLGGGGITIFPWQNFLLKVYILVFPWHWLIFNSYISFHTLLQNKVMQSNKLFKTMGVFPLSHDRIIIQIFFTSKFNFLKQRLIYFLSNRFNSYKVIQKVFVSCSVLKFSHCWKQGTEWFFFHHMTRKCSNIQTLYT